MVHPTLDADRAFNAKFSIMDYNAFACKGGIRQTRFITSPFIRKQANSITVDTNYHDYTKNACIYQHT